MNVVYVCVCKGMRTYTFKNQQNIIDILYSIATTTTLYKSLQQPSTNLLHMYTLVTLI